jgi:hypothetical protein
MGAHGKMICKFKGAVSVGLDRLYQDRRNAGGVEIPRDLDSRVEAPSEAPACAQALRSKTSTIPP